MFGSRVAQGLRRMNNDEFPVVILSHGKGGSHEVCEMIKGKRDYVCTP